MKFVPSAISRKVARVSLEASKNSPNLLFGLGVAGMVGSTVLACRATLKVHEITNEMQSDLGMAKAMENPEYSDRDRQKDIAIIYSRGIGRMARLYGPSILLGAASIGALTKSHNMLNERNLALTAAYAAVDKAFGEYRQRVVEKYGSDQDQEFRYASEEVEILDGKGKLVLQKRVAPGDHSMYARWFDEESRQWSADPEYNYVFLRCQQNWANDMLKARGHVFLNEVYDALGLERTSPGSVVGWVNSPDSGDNYIDFGIFEQENLAFRDFTNGRDGSMLLDFNVDGVIYDQLDGQRKQLS